MYRKLAEQNFPEYLSMSYKLRKKKKERKIVKSKLKGIL